MSRTTRTAQDILGILRGLQLVARAAAQSQEQYLKHLWANSSVRDVVEDNLQCTQICVQSFVKNPQKELDVLVKKFQETMERSSVVVEGVRQFTVSTAAIDAKSLISTSPAMSSSTAQDAAKSSPAGTNLDISSITLKELESILSQRTRKVNLTTNESPKSTKSNDEPKISPMDKKPSAATVKDEKYVAEWMNYITKHDEAKSETATSIQPPPSSEQTATHPIPKKPSQINLPELSSAARQRSVPSSRIGRMTSFGTLFAGLGVGTVSELAKGAIGFGGATNVKEALFSPGNTERIVNTLCKVRGAALKIGQILSIQDSNLVAPEMIKAFERVRQAADYMPDWQVEKCMSNEFGRNWRTEHLSSFDAKPFAAASIGQVHRAVLKEDDMPVAIKIQYPGVAQSIESDIDNLVGMLKVWDVFPAGFFIDNIVKVAKRELVWEVDYIREAEYTEKFREMIAPYKEYRVPKVIRQLTTRNVLTTELVPGVAVDKCFNLGLEDRLFIARAVLRLCLRELFELQCMQTDPNWSNFLYDADARQLVLIDFGSTRFYTNEFIDNYRNVIRAAVRDDGAEVLALSRKMGFLTGYETKQMEDAHVTAVMTLGELFRYPGEFDFGKQNTTKRIASLVPTMVAHRLCPPPEEIYSIHRKLSGVFLLCARLNVKMDCRPIYREIVEKS